MLFFTRALSNVTSKQYIHILIMHLFMFSSKYCFSVAVARLQLLYVYSLLDNMCRMPPCHPESVRTYYVRTLILQKEKKKKKQQQFFYVYSSLVTTNTSTALLWAFNTFPQVIEQANRISYKILKNYSHTKRTNQPTNSTAPSIKEKKTKKKKTSEVVCVVLIIVVFKTKK